MNAYDLLGIRRDADLEEIKQAYRRIAKELHPDVNAGDTEAADRFKAITAAYNLLADAKKRVEYDRNQPDHDAGAEPQPWEKGGAWFDVEIDERTGGRIIDLYGDVAGNRMGRVKGVQATSMTMKGQDVAADLQVTESEARDGVCKLVSTFTGLTVAVDVPAGVRNGQVITVEGFGIEGFGGGPPGDLNAIVEIVPDPSLAGPAEDG